MSTAQKSRWAIRLVGFCCAAAIVLFTLASILGRPLTVWEAISLVGCAGAGVASFAWAFSAGRPEQAALKGAAVVETFSSSEPHPLASVVDWPPTESIGDTGPRIGKATVTLANAAQPADGSGIQSVVLGGGAEAIGYEGAARQSHELRWFGRGETVTVGDFVLKSPMVYVSDGLPREDEHSCIYRRLEIGRPLPERIETLVSYPTYAGISPIQRAHYLRWLSRGRIDPLRDLGYALLFLHGLERRLLLERKDTGAIVTEVIRLLETYTLWESFDRRLTQFLAFSLARYGVENLDSTLFRRVFEKSRLVREDGSLAVALAWFYTRKEPLPASWALRIARRDLRPPCSDVLFEELYGERFGRGLVLTASGGDRHVFYLPSNRALSVGLAAAESWGGFAKVPDVLGVKSQFAPLELLWKSCNKESPSTSISRPKERPIGDNLVQPPLAATVPTSAQVMLAARVDEPDNEMRGAHVEVTPRLGGSAPRGPTTAKRDSLGGIGRAPRCRTV